ncbi:MAG: glycosyl transferase family protein [Bryobacteraceae bacterium]
MDYLFEAAVEELAGLAGAGLPFLLGWLILSGLDDLVLLGAYLLACPAGRAPTREQLDSVPRKLIAVFVPCWHEDAVIAAMLRHNLGASRYADYRFFVGVYPNDPATAAAVEAVAAEDSRVVAAVCPRPGPTSKADCMNAIYGRMEQYERAHGLRFEMMVVHDAEDLIHPDEFEWLNYWAETYAMIQLPVLALPTPWHEITHGIYCDDFAQFHTIELAARVKLGGFLPSAGVGTAYRREALERIMREDGLLFDPGSLTEDYENGLRLARMGARQMFLPITWADDVPVATREFFPRRFQAAMRQRTRWTTGIAMQAWERHGWGKGWERYWFWRDRKGLLGHPLSLVATAVAAFSALMWATGRAGLPEHPFLNVTAAFGLGQMSMRAVCCGRIYGWRFAAMVPVRLLAGHVLNTFAVAKAVADFGRARFRGVAVAWRKTDHDYPEFAALAGHRRKLGEILVGMGYLRVETVEQAMAAKPGNVRLGRFLVDNGKLTEMQLYEGLARQAAVPLGTQGIGPRLTAPVFPVRVIRGRKVVPLAVEKGSIIVATSELPDEGVRRELKDWTRMPLRFRLVTPGEFEKLCEEVL